MQSVFEGRCKPTPGGVCWNCVITARDVLPHWSDVGQRLTGDCVQNNIKCSVEFCAQLEDGRRFDDKTHRSLGCCHQAVQRRQLSANLSTQRILVSNAALQRESSVMNVAWHLLIGSILNACDLNCCFCLFVIGSCYRWKDKADIKVNENENVLFMYFFLNIAIDCFK